MNISPDWITAATSAAVVLAAASFLAILFHAFTLSGRAGPSRLEEKFPNHRRRLQRWAPRWEILRLSLLSALRLCEIGALILFAIAVARNATSAALLSVAVLLLVLIVALDLLPVSIAESYADRISLLFLPLAAFLARIFWPLARLLQGIQRRLTARIRSRADAEDHPSPEDAIRSLLGSQTHADDLEEEEREIIRSVFEFGETVAREIMTPRVDIEGVEDNDTIAACIERIKDSRHSRFPVFHENPDDVRGVIHVKDLLRLSSEGQDKTPVIRILKPLPFVPESMPINDLLQLLRAQQAQMAIVVDEYGGTAGLVTVEDILEELVGEIHDEYDTRDSTIHRLSDGSSVLSARLPVEEANKLLSVHIPVSDEYDSLGGYIFQALGRIPRAGETLEGGDFHLTVQAADQRQIHLVRIRPKTESTAPTPTRRDTAAPPRD